MKHLVNYLKSCTCRVYVKLNLSSLLSSSKRLLIAWNQSKYLEIYSIEKFLVIPIIILEIPSVYNDACALGKQIQCVDPNDGIDGVRCVTFAHNPSIGPQATIGDKYLLRQCSCMQVNKKQEEDEKDLAMFYPSCIKIHAINEYKYNINKNLIFFNYSGVNHST